MPDLIPIVERRINDELVGLPARSVQNQDGIDSCFSCAFTTAQEARDASEPPLAGASHYRRANPSLENGGVSDSRAFQMMAEFGIATYKSYFGSALNSNQVTWDCAHFNSALPVKTDLARQEGLSRRLEQNMQWNGPGIYRILETIPSREVRRWLMLGVPSIIIIKPCPAYRNFKIPRARNIDFLLTPEPPFEDLAHAVCVIGYLPSQQAFIVQDSRGIGFGAEGQWLLPENALRINRFLRAVYVWNSPIRNSS